MRFRFALRLFWITLGLFDVVTSILLGFASDDWNVMRLNAGLVMLLLAQEMADVDRLKCRSSEMRDRYIRAKGRAA